MTAAVVSAPSVVYDALASVSAGHGFKKAKYTIREGSKAGDGFSSILYRVTITDEEKSGNPEKLVVMCKTTLADDVGRTLIQYFKSEETLYNRVLPSIKAVASFTEPLPWPRCLYAKDNSSGRPCLVFEDLCEEGFLTVNRAVVPDVQHFRLALSQLAKFHGAGMAFQHLQPILFKDIAKGLVLCFDDPAEMKKFEQLSNIIKSSMVMIEDRFPTDGEVYGKIQLLYSRMQEGFMSMAVVPEPAPGIGLMHGDCHLNNMMFKYDKESKKVQACRLIDFQLSRAGNTAIDLMTLMLVCTDKSLRDAHWDDLLRGYHAELQDTLKAAGISNPDTIYTWEQFMGCVQEATKFCLCLCPLALHAMQTDEKAALELRDAMNEFHKSDDGKVNLPFNVDLSLSIKQRFGDVIQSVVDWGWL